MHILEWLRNEVFNARMRQELEGLRAQLASQNKDLGALQVLVSAKIHKYECIICGEDFAILPGQSPKRCGACMREIRETQGLSNGNGQHRNAGHNTRNQHKQHPAVKA